jgi:hypothetical protein
MDPDEPPEYEPPSVPDIFKSFGLELTRASVSGVDDDFLTRILAIYHEEWERRHGERWVLST